MRNNTQQTPWGLVLILFGAGILSAFQVGKAPPVLTDIRVDLDINLLYAGWLLSIFNLTGLMMGTFAGGIADTLGHRRLMLTGLCLQIAGCISGSFADSFTGLLVTRFLEGSGFLSVAVSTPTLIFQVVKPKDIKVALSIWSCYFPLGGSMMMVLLPLVMHATDWRGLWRINAVLLLFYVFLLAQKTKDLKFKPLSNDGVSFGLMFKNMFKTATKPGPLLLSMSFIAYAMQWLAVIGFLPTLMLEEFGFSKSMASVLTAIMVFVNIFGNLAGGWMLKRGFTRWKLMAGASFMMGVCAFFIYGAGFHFILNYFGCLTFSICGGLIPACVLGGVPLYAPSDKLVATTNGLVVQGGQSGQFIGPPALAFLVSQTGTWSCGAWFLGSVALMGIIISFCLSKIPCSEQN